MRTDTSRNQPQIKTVGNPAFGDFQKQHDRQADFEYQPVRDFGERGVHFVPFVQKGADHHKEKDRQNRVDTVGQIRQHGM